MSERGPAGGGGVAERLFTRQFLILMASASVFFIGGGGINALLPRVVVDDLGRSESMAGVVMGSAAVTALFTRPWFGRMADRAGARRLMVLGAAVAAAAMLVFAAWESLGGALAGRLIHGAGGAAMVTGATMLGIELAPEERRSQAAALVLVSFHVGMGIGPLLTEWMVDQLSAAEVWTILGIATAVSGVIAMGLAHRPGDPTAAPAPLVHRAALLPGTVSLLGIFAFNGFILFLPLYVREVGMDDAGPVFLTVSVTIVIVRVAFGRFPDVVGPIRAGSIALVLTIGAALLVAWWDAPVGVFVGGVLLAIGLSWQSPSLIAVAVRDVPASERGSVMATFTGFFDVANALIGPAVGLIVDGLGYRTAYVATAVFAAIALVMLRTVVAPAYERGIDSAP